MLFNYTSEQLFKKSAGAGVLLEVVVDGLVFKLWRDEDLALHFLHSSPSTGTRIATVNLNALSPRPTIGIALVWSPAETRLHMLNPQTATELAAGRGSASSTDVRVGADSGIYEVGSPGVEVMGARVFQAGAETLGPSAINVWAETQSAANVLLTGTSQEGFIFEGRPSQRHLGYG